MENAYGIGVKNRFFLFMDEEQDPLDAIKDSETVRDKKKTDKGAEKENKSKLASKGKAAPIKKINPKESQLNNQLSGKTQNQLDSQPLKKDDNRNRGNAGRNTSNDKSVKFGSGQRYNEGSDLKDIEEKKNRRNREGFDFRDNEYRRGGGRGAGGRGRGRGRGGYDSRGKREFDRQSGSDRSGVKPVDKRDGAGSHNWGTMKDDMEQREQLNTTLDDSQEWNEKSGEQSAEQTESKDTENTEATAEDEAGKEETEDEPKEMTLDEYKKQQAAARAVPKFNLRKPGEGEDNAQWKKTFRLEKKKMDDDSEEESDEEEEEEIRRGRSKHTVDIDIQFSDSRRGGGRGTGGRGRGGGSTRGRGGSGGSNNFDRPFRGRGGSDRPYRGGRGGMNGPKGGQNAPNMLDENDFPSLS